MFTLFFSPTSPFVRKVTVYASELGLEDLLVRERAVVSPSKPNLALAIHNPLMKVPTLINESGDAVFGSRAICFYLESYAKETGWQDNGKDDASSRTLVDLCHGMLQAGLLVREDILRLGPGGKDGWREGQILKVEQGIGFLNHRLDAICAASLLTKVTVAVTLDWLMFRGFLDSSQLELNLREWQQEFSQRRSMLSTRPTPDAYTASSVETTSRSES